MKHGKHGSAREWISHKIGVLREEGYKQDQAVAIAHEMARDLYGKDAVPKKKKGR